MQESFRRVTPLSVRIIHGELQFAVRSTQKFGTQYTKVLLFVCAPQNVHKVVAVFKKETRQMWHLKSKQAHFSSARLERAYFGHFKLTVVKHGLMAIEQ